MSYDIHIWSIQKVKLSDSLPSPEKWKINDRKAIFQGNSWQIVVNESAKVENEDIPENIDPFLPGIEYLTEVNLEPIHAPSSARLLLQQYSKHIAKEIIGVISDPQDDTVAAPSGVKRYSPPKSSREEPIPPLEMSWWFGKTVIANEKLFSQLIDYFARKLPEGLPRRYGLFEPPQYKYKDSGKERLKHFLLENVNDSIVWYPNKPVLSVNYSFSKEFGVINFRNRKQFSSKYLFLEFDSKAIEQKGWQELLRKVFLDISKLLNPFYAEVRNLSEHYSTNGKTVSEFLTGPHPEKYWWRGIPKNLGQAIVIGEDYLPLWPEIKKRGEKIGQDYFVSTEDWKSGANITGIVGTVPENIREVDPPVRYDESGYTLDDDTIYYPKSFPFYKKKNDN